MAAEPSTVEGVIAYVMRPNHPTWMGIAYTHRGFLINGFEADLRDAVRLAAEMISVRASIIAAHGEERLDVSIPCVVGFLEERLDAQCASELLQISVKQLDVWVRKGLIKRVSEGVYEYQDIVRILHTQAALTTNGVGNELQLEGIL